MAGTATDAGYVNSAPNESGDCLDGYRDELEQLAETDLRTAKYAKMLLEMGDK